MRIRDAYTKLDRPVRTDATSKTPDASTRTKDAKGASAPDQASTNVVLSSKARELSASADTSSARVAAFREQISRGELRVDAKAIAAKMIGDDG